MGGLDDIISTTERSVGSHITKEGYPIGSFYGYNAIGIMSKADYANALLDREVYLAIWIVTFALLGFYLLGKLPGSREN